MPIEPATYPDILLVAATMRDSDACEIYAQMYEESPVAVAMSAMESEYKFVYRREDGAVVAAFGAKEIWPHFWGIWMFANDLWGVKAGRDIVRFARRTHIDLIARGAHRLECKSTIDHPDAHRFIEAMGLRREAEHPFYGKDGETFVTFAWVREKPVKKI